MDDAGDGGSRNAPEPPAAEIPLSRELITRVGPGSNINFARPAQPIPGVRRTLTPTLSQIPTPSPNGAPRSQFPSVRLPVSQQQRVPQIRYDTSPSAQLLRHRQTELYRLTRHQVPGAAPKSLMNRVTTVRRAVIAPSLPTQQPNHPSAQPSLPPISTAGLAHAIVEQAATRALYVMEGGANNVDSVTGRPLLVPTGRAAAAPPWVAMSAQKKPRGRPPLRRNFKEIQQKRSTITPLVSNLSSDTPTTSAASATLMDREKIEQRRAEHVEQERQARLLRQAASQQPPVSHSPVEEKPIKTNGGSTEDLAKEIEWAAKLCHEEKLRIQSATNEKARQETLDRMRTIDRVARKKRSNDESSSDPDKVEDQELPSKSKKKKIVVPAKEEVLDQIMETLNEDEKDLLTDEGKQRRIEEMDRQREEEKKRMMEAEAKRKECEVAIEKSKIEETKRAARVEQDKVARVLEIHRKIKEDVDRKLKLAEEEEEKARKRKRCKKQLEEEKLMTEEGLAPVAWDGSESALEIDRRRSEYRKKIRAIAENEERKANEEKMRLATIIAINRLQQPLTVDTSDEKFAGLEKLAMFAEEELKKETGDPKAKDIGLLAPQSDSSSEDPDKLHGSQRRKGRKPQKLDTETQDFVGETSKEVTKEAVTQVKPKPLEIKETPPKPKSRKHVLPFPEWGAAEIKAINRKFNKKLPRRKKKRDLIKKKEEQVQPKSALAENPANAREDVLTNDLKVTPAQLIEKIGTHFDEKFEHITITFYPKQIFYGEFELEVNQNCSVSFVCDKLWPRIELSLSSKKFHVFPLKHVNTIATACSLFGDFPPVLSLLTTGMDDHVKNLCQRYKMFKKDTTSDGHSVFRCHPDGFMMILDVSPEDSRSQCKIRVKKDAETKFEYSITGDAGFEILDTNYQLNLALHPILMDRKISFKSLTDFNFWDYSNHLRIVWVHIIHERRQSRWIAKCREDLELACESNFIEFDADMQTAFSLYPPTHRFRPLQRESNSWFDDEYRCREPFPVKFKEYPQMLFESDVELEEEEEDVPEFSNPADCIGREELVEENNRKSVTPEEFTNHNEPGPSSSRSNEYYYNQEGPSTSNWNEPSTSRIRTPIPLEFDLEGFVMNNMTEEEEISQALHASIVEQRNQNQRARNGYVEEMPMDSNFEDDLYIIQSHESDTQIAATAKE